MAGLTTTGFEALTYDQIVAELQSSYQDKWPNLDVDVTKPDSVAGGEIAILANELSKLWALGLAIWNSLDLDTVGGMGLDLAAGITGVTRKAATPSTATVTCTATQALTIPAGSVIATASGFEVLTDSDLIFAAAGSIDVTVTARDPGATSIAAAALTVIVTPVTGWSAVTNASAGTTGTDSEKDSILRERIQSEGTPRGCRTRASLSAALNDLAEVQSALVVDNDTDAVDANGIPAHSFEVVLFGSGIDADEVGDLIWTHKPSGANSHGDISVIVTDEEGHDQTVFYSTATGQNIEVTVLITSTANWPSDGPQQVRDKLDELINTNGQVGVDVRTYKLYEALASIDGIESMTITTDVLGGTPDASNVVITNTQIARINDSDTDVTVTVT